MMKAESYRIMLQKELDLIKKKNKSFSIRAMAKMVGLSPAHISLVLLGKKNLSVSSSEKIALKLKWSEAKTKKFINLVQIEHASSEHSKSAALEQINKITSHDLNFNPLALDVFEVISKWYYGAILTALTIKDFKATTKSISDRFGLNMMETSLALERLQKLNLIKLEQRRWVATNRFLDISNISSDAIRRYHKEMLTLAASALTEQDLDERDFSNFTFVADSTRIPEAKKRIKEFCKELFTFMQGDKPKEVYQLSVQLFKLD